MTPQGALWSEHWSDHWGPGQRVRSSFTGNVGQVTHVERGRHLLIRWQAMGGRDGYVVRHSSPQGLERVEP
jgi:hypothetical protein